MALLVFLALLIVTLVGAPLFTVIGGSAMIGFHREGFDLSVVENFFGLAESSVLVSIPLFTFAGFLLSAGQAPKRLVSLSQALLGWLPGGLAMISLVTCALFTRSPERRASRSSRSARCSTPRSRKPAMTRDSTWG